MSEIKTNLKLKTASDTYTTKYPVSKSTIINRDTSTNPIIVGNNLQECIQTTANRYIPQNGKSWITFTPPSGSGDKAICSDGNFIFMKIGNKCKWSFNGGKSFNNEVTCDGFASGTVMNCKRTLTSNNVTSYHVALAYSGYIRGIRIDNESTIINETYNQIATSITSPNSVFFTDGAWYVYGATTIAKITNLNGGTATTSEPASHTHMSYGMYAADMGMYVAIDNGTVVISDAKVGGN